MLGLKDQTKVVRREGRPLGVLQFGFVFFYLRRYDERSRDYQSGSELELLNQIFFCDSVVLESICYCTRAKRHINEGNTTGGLRNIWTGS